MSFSGMPEENNHIFWAQQRNYADDGRVNLLLLRKIEDMMLKFQQMERKLAEFDGKLVELTSTVNELSAILKSNAQHNAHNSRQRWLNLQFTDQISCPIRTGDEIKGVGGSYIKVALVDETGKLVDSGLESSAEVQIFALKGDVDDTEGDSGENGYFVNDIARERKTKKSSILVGDLELKLNKGIGILANIKFRSSSSHLSGVFKIGARVVDRFDGVVVQDAKTVSFRVKDYRGKYNEKHRPPCLSDEIWRLDNIGRDGPIHDCLMKHHFNTVEDFLIQLLKDSDWLKKLVKLQPKKWEATVKHAQTCQLDKKVYYCINFELNKGIVFNAVGKILGLIVESKYTPLDKLSDEVKVNASKLDVAAFVYKREIVSVADEASLLLQFPGPVNAMHPSNSVTSQNTIDHEGEVSETVDSHQTRLDTLIDDVPSSSHPIELEYLDQKVMEALFDDCDNYQTASFSDMLHGSSIISNNEVKKKLFFLFSVTKWLLYHEKMAACDGNDNQKRRRTS